MIEDIKYATISKIYVKDLICFNNTKSKNLKTFCLENGITYLPSLDKKSCFRLNGDKFVNSKLTNDLICNAYDRLFDETTIAKFESGKHDEVMFVVEDNKIKGVVHLVDYNSAFINFEFYKAIYELETNLRQILIQAGETNDTLLKWFLLESKKNQHWKRRYTQCVPNDKKRSIEQNLKRKECNPFQTFFLNDLLHFAVSKKYVSSLFSSNISSIINIRNWVAHNKDLAHTTKTESKVIYKIDELKQFVKDANQFFKCYEELEDLL